MTRLRTRPPPLKRGRQNGRRDYSEKQVNLTEPDRTSPGRDYSFPSSQPDPAGPTRGGARGPRAPCSSPGGPR
jgi:hypothetical protein